MTTQSLSKTKQTTVVGGDVNYYLIHIDKPTNVSIPFDVEVEDIIERFEMSFALGTVFKSMVRLCKLRMDLGKPGSDSLYEAQKIAYYTLRTFAVSSRKEDAIGWVGKSVRYVRDLPFRHSFKNLSNIELDVPTPKRLAPYSFVVNDVINALNPTFIERVILGDVFRVALMRLVSGPVRADEKLTAALAAKNAKVLVTEVENGRNNHVQIIA